MSELLNTVEYVLHFAEMTHKEEITLADNYRVTHLIVAQRKRRMEYFVFDTEDVAGLDDDALREIVQSSPLVKEGLEVNSSEVRDGYLYVGFNKMAYYEYLDMFDKKFLNITKDTRIQREYHIGKGYNPNPKLYKYVWWVFHNGVQSDNVAALINTKESRFIYVEDAQACMNELSEKGEPYVYVQKAFPRLGVKVFDYEKMREKEPDSEFAPALEEDEEYHDK